jgi:hypothetical protein
VATTARGDETVGSVGTHAVILLDLGEQITQDLTRLLKGEALDKIEAATGAFIG